MFSTRGSTGKEPFVNAGPLITTGPANNADPDVVLETGNEQQMYLSQLQDQVVDEIVSGTSY